MVYTSFNLIKIKLGFILAKVLQSFNLIKV
jgi:hypothetical protein